MSPYKSFVKKGSRRVYFYLLSSPRTRTQEMSRTEEWISASFKERIFFAMQSSEDFRAFGILLVITVDLFGFSRYLTLMLCFEDSFAADWSIIVDYAFNSDTALNLHGYILFLCEWREESRKWRNLNYLYQHQQQLTNYSCTTDTIFKNMAVGGFLPSNNYQWYAAELYCSFMSRSIRRSYKLSDLVLFHSISLHIYEFYIWGNITLFLSAQLLHSE